MNYVVATLAVVPLVVSLRTVTLTLAFAQRRSKKKRFAIRISGNFFLEGLASSDIPEISAFFDACADTFQMSRLRYDLNCGLRRSLFASLASF